MDIKLIAMDMDGTLLSGEKLVPDENIRALRECEARGIMTVLASGRAFESIRQLAKAMGINSPIISANGARVDESPDGPPLMVDVFEPDVAERVYRMLMDDGVFFVIYAPGTMYQSNLNGYEDTNRGLNRGVLRAGREFTGPAQIEVVRDRRRTQEEGLYRAMKFVLFNKDPARLARLRAAFEPMGLYMSSSDDESLELMMPDAGKGRALEFLMRHYGLERNQVMAFGDYVNDLTMLAAAGYPVAMGNALDAVKQIAWTVAPTNDEAGVGRTIRRYVLEADA